MKSFLLASIIAVDKLRKRKSKKSLQVYLIDRVDAACDLNNDITTDSSGFCPIHTCAIYGIITLVQIKQIANFLRLEQSNEVGHGFERSHSHRHFEAL